MNSDFPSNLTKSIAGLLFLENYSIKEGYVLLFLELEICILTALFFKYLLCI